MIVQTTPGLELIKLSPDKTITSNEFQSIIFTPQNIGEVETVQKFIKQVLENGAEPQPTDTEEIITESMVKELLKRPGVNSYAVSKKGEAALQIWHKRRGIDEEPKPDFDTEFNGPAIILRIITGVP